MQPTDPVALIVMHANRARLTRRQVLLRVIQLAALASLPDQGQPGLAERLARQIARSACDSQIAKLAMQVMDLLAEIRKPGGMQAGTRNDVWLLIARLEAEVRAVPD